MGRVLTVKQPLVLELCCGVGGSTRGFQQSGFHTIGIDHIDQPEYCGERFIKADITTLTPADLRTFNPDWIHAGPPCQDDCTLTAGTNRGTRYPNHTVFVQKLLKDSGIPYSIENPTGRTPLRRDMILCGEMFGLAVIRHRIFEFSEHFKPPVPPHRPHRGRVAGMRHGVWYQGPYFAVYGDGGGKGSVAQWRDAMGIDWTWNRKSIAEAVPPAYTRYIGSFIYDWLIDAHCV